MVLREDFRDALPDVPDTFEYIMNIEGDIYRQMDGRRTLRFDLAGRSWFLKAHSGIGWREIFKNLLQLRLPVTGARPEWRGIKKLQSLAIETMPLVAYGQRGLNPACMHSFVVTEDLTGTESLETVSASWDPAGADLGLKRVMIERIAHIARTLHYNGVNHCDFYLAHFLLKARNADITDNPHLYVIDLHRMQLRHRTPRRWVIKDLAALFFSSMDAGLTRRDMYRFMVLYSDMPLRAILQKQAPFWTGVRIRACGLYRSFHGREAPSIFRH